MKTIALLLACVACAPDVPAEPTWTEDVMPVVRANCTRCHGDDTSGGAPVSFQLDRPSDHIDRWGDKIRGARTLAVWMSGRVHNEEAPMPPYGPPLSGRQREILARWAGDEPRDRPELGPANKPPRFVLTEPLQGTVDLGTTIHTFAEDREDDFVHGELWYGMAGAGPQVRITDQVRSGVGTHDWDTTHVDDGTYEIFAVIFNESRRVTDEKYGEVTPSLGSVTVAHASGNTAPFVTFERLPVPYATCPEVEPAPRPDQLFHQAFAQPEDRTIRVFVHDPDSTVLTPTFTAHRPGLADIDLNGVTVTANLAGCVIEALWDLAADPTVTDGNWQIEVSVEDGAGGRGVAVSPFFIVSRAPPYETFDELAPLLGVSGDQPGGVSCTSCHQEIGYIPEMSVLPGEIEPWLGRIYRRVVDRRDMPPLGFQEGGPLTLTDAQRDELGKWILGGALEITNQ